MAEVTMKTSAFFDKQAVISRLGPAKARIYGYAGGTVARIMRNSIRTRKSTSEPGSPPHSHTGLLKHRIFYAYDQAKDSVVVGPDKTNQVFFNGDGRPVTGTVPQVLDEGGQIRVLEVLRRGGWSRADLRSRRRLAERRTRMRTVNVRARPFTTPALMTAKSKYAERFRNSIVAV